MLARIAGFVLPALAGAFLPAQTFVVDAANGPGTNFTTIAAAVAAVPDGSTLLVRPGGYGAFAIDGKGLTLLGGPGVVLTAASTLFPAYGVSNTQPGQTTVLRGFAFGDWMAGLGLTRCGGEVVLEDVVLGVTSCGCLTSPSITWWIRGCAQVTVRDGTAWSAVVDASNVVFERCTMNGLGTTCGFGQCSTPFVALTATASDVQLVDCTVRGGNGGGGFPNRLVQNRPAIRLAGGSVRILAPCTVAAGDDPLQRVPAVAAIDGSGVLRIDPAVVVQSAATPPIAATLNVTFATMPATVGTSAPLGGTIGAAATAASGSLVVLLVGQPGAAVQLPGIADAFWLDATANAFASFGVVQPGVPVTATIQVPNVTVFLGARVAWQAVGFDTTGLQASNPTVTLVR